MGLEIFTLWERPDLRPLIFGSDLDLVWPEFMRHDPVAHLYFAPTMLDWFRDYAFVGIAGGKVVARAFSVPFAFNIDGRTELPDGGWDEVIRWAHDDWMTDRYPTALSALEISLLPEARGGGNSMAFLDAMKRRARARGLTEMFAPVRPIRKHLHPSMPMREYLDRVDADGLPVDPWLRTHVRAGATIAKIAPHSMTITGTIKDWSRWTGMSFDRTGEVTIPGGLVPLVVSLEHDYAVYVEPNVWVRYAL
jgi:GNAT superfamily N-acetyltransferase